MLNSALTLADLIMSGKVLNGCHLGGGLHHAQPGRASGLQQLWHYGGAYV
jgi:acetoin utilization protein AcuC